MNPGQFPAFPNDTPETAYAGVSIRTYIATAALQGLLAEEEGSTSTYEELAIEAIGYADALLKALQTDTTST